MTYLSARGRPPHRLRGGRRRGGPVAHPRHCACHQERPAERPEPGPGDAQALGWTVGAHRSVGGRPERRGAVLMTVAKNPKPCSKCSRPATGRGLCNTHYSQWRRKAQLGPTPRRRASDVIEDARWLLDAGETVENTARRCGSACRGPAIRRSASPRRGRTRSPAGRRHRRWRRHGAGCAGGGRSGRQGSCGSGSCRSPCAGAGLLVGDHRTGAGVGCVGAPGAVPAGDSASGGECHHVTRWARRSRRASRAISDSVRPPQTSPRSPTARNAST